MVATNASALAHIAASAAFPTAQSPQMVLRLLLLLFLAALGAAAAAVDVTEAPTTVYGVDRLDTADPCAGPDHCEPNGRCTRVRVVNDSDTVLGSCLCRPGFTGVACNQPALTTSTPSGGDHNWALVILIVLFFLVASSLGGAVSLLILLVSGAEKRRKGARRDEASRRSRSPPPSAATATATPSPETALYCLYERRPPVAPESPFAEYTEPGLVYSCHHDRGHGGAQSNRITESQRDPGVPSRFTSRSVSVPNLQSNIARQRSTHNSNNQ